MQAVFVPAARRTLRMELALHEYRSHCFQSLSCGFSSFVRFVHAVRDHSKLGCSEVAI